MNGSNNLMVRVEDVYKSYGSEAVETKVFAGLDMEVQEGSVVVIFGPSGSGKTTLLNLIGAMDKPDSGTVRVDGEGLIELDYAGLAEFRRKKVGFVFQFFNLMRNLTALENVELALEISGMRGKDVRERAFHYLHMVDLRGAEDKLPRELSGGMRQRVAIARALAKEPRLVLADEPTGQLDESNAMRIAELMVKLHEQLKITFIVVTHNQRIAQIAEKIFYISGGRLNGTQL